MRHLPDSLPRYAELHEGLARMTAPHRPLVAITTTSFADDSTSYCRSLLEAGFRIVRNTLGRRLREDEVVHLARDAVGIIAGTERLTDSVLRATPRLQVISRCGVGIDNIDTGSAARLGIEVTTTPLPLVEAAAELTVGLMLSACRRIAEADRSLRSGRWKPLMGMGLKTKTVGLVGCGRVGQEVIRLLRDFEPRLLVTDPIRLPADFMLSHRVEQIGLLGLLRLSDVVTLHMPYGPDVHHLIGATELAEMKPGAVLVNTSRGGLIDELALRDALLAGRLRAAALDTYEEEPYAGPLADISATTLTCHMGSYAQESRQQAEAEAVRNLLAALRAPER